MFLKKTDFDSLAECGFLKKDTNRLCIDFKNKLLEQTEEYLDFYKNEEESILTETFCK